MLVQNYGLAIILFSILLKVVILPVTIKEQIVRRKTAKIQGQVKEIQKKYKKDPQKMHRETMDLYKKEKMNPFSGCMPAIIQMVLIFAMFMLVRSPLTYMRDIDDYTLQNITEEIRYELGDDAISPRFPEISIIRYVNSVGDTDSELYIDMRFLGLDLSNTPIEDFRNPTVYIIPAMFVVSSMISMKLVMSINQKSQAKKEVVLDKDGNPEKPEPDMMMQMSKNMMWMMPILTVGIVFNAPLGLALYWLTNNILMITVILILNKILSSREEKENGGQEDV